MSRIKRYETARREQDEAKVNDCKAILSILFRYSAYPPSIFFERIVHYVTGTDEQGWDVFTELILGEVETAGNPLTPGMAVSVALAELQKRHAKRNRGCSYPSRREWIHLC